MVADFQNSESLIEVVWCCVKMSLSKFANACYVLLKLFSIPFLNLFRMFDWAACGIRAFTKHNLLCRLDPTTQSRNSSAMAEFYVKAQRAQKIGHSPSAH